VNKELVMNVDVIMNKKAAKKVSAEKLREACVFYAGILMSDRLTANLDIEIIVSETGEIAGSCGWEDTSYRPKMFTIELSLDADDDIFRNLAHEMVHVKQYRSGELQELVRAKKIKFNGKEYSDEYYTNVDMYYDAPWEVIAYGREVGLYRKWLIREGK